MNQKKLKHIAKIDRDIDALAVSDLNDLMHKFPYFAWPYTVLAKHYINHQDYRSETLLHQSALRIHDRTWLYRYLHSSFEEDLPSEANEIKPEPHIPVEEKKPFDQAEIQVNNEVIIPNQLETQEDDLIKINPQITEFENTPTEQPVNQEPVKYSEEPTERESYLSKPLFIPELTETTKERITENTDPAPKVIPVYDLEKIYGTDASKNREPIVGNASQNFYEWLNRTTHKKEETGPELEPNLKQQKNLIEKFLINRPSISRPKQEFFKPEKAYKKGEIMSGQMVTETLAKIYLKQENPEKAIWAYEQLQLKFPEKMAYFANLIEQIKQEYLKS